jgi:PPK2 family polyphosphate:nucleotide phosphotransferase
MFNAPKSPYLVPFDGSFRVADAPTKPPRGAPDKKKLKSGLAEMVKDLRDWQRKLYAEDRRSLLLIFQAMDAAGKDGTIRHVLSGINPAGFQVSSFKRPSELELDHDYLWRTTCALPERGRIGVFNRSSYEEVLVVRVHPGILAGQRIPTPDPKTIWQERFQSMADLEQHLARNGTTVLKFWLNVSLMEQKKRFLARIDEAEKNWKFAEGDVKERAHWPQYMQAYEEALGATSRAHAPWYAIPADSKPFMRYTVARIIRDAFEQMAPDFPTVSDERRAELQAMRGQLEQA